MYRALNCQMSGWVIHKRLKILVGIGKKQLFNRFRLAERGWRTRASGLQPWKERTHSVCWPNGKASDYESGDCRFDPCVDHQQLASLPFVFLGQRGGVPRLVVFVHGTCEVHYCVLLLFLSPLQCDWLYREKDWKIFAMHVLLTASHMSEILGKRWYGIGCQNNMFP